MTIYSAYMPPISILIASLLLFNIAFGEEPTLVEPDTQTDVDSNNIPEDNNSKIDEGITIIIKTDGTSNDQGKKSNQTKDGYIKIVEMLLSFASSISWPTGVLLIAFMFKREIKKLLTRLKKGKLGNSEFEFDEFIQDAEADSSINDQTNPSELSPEILTLASTDPRTAIITKWLEIEKLIDILVQKFPKTKYYPKRGILSSIRLLQDNDKIPKEYISLIHDLRVLRNEAAHSYEFYASPDSIIRYLKLSNNVIDALKRHIENSD